MKDLYFISNETRIIFGLVKLEGKQQLDFLGIDYEYYSNKKLANEWYTETKEKIAGSKHPKLETALANLEKLYKGMK
ncbi:J domain-containing protein [Fusobacterium sp. oral taxon C10]